MFKKILSSTLISLVIISSVSAAFTDVDESHMYYDSISFVEEQGIVQGYNDGTYKPDNKINRAEMLKIIVEAFYTNDYNEETEDKDCFFDLDTTAWYPSYVCFSKSHKIIKGYLDGSFKPAQNITFVEALKITLIASGHEYIESEPWYKGLVETASNKNYIPLSIKTLDQEINRGEMADMIARILISKEGNLDEFLGSNANYRISYEELEENTENPDEDNEDNNNEEVDLNNPPSSGKCDEGTYSTQLLCFLNKYRSEHKLEALVIDENLNTVAQAHSEWMSKNQELTHTAEGKDPFDRCDDGKVECNAENIAMSSQVSAEIFYKLWIESPPHEKNILGDYKTVGIGLSGDYSTTLFAK